MVVAEGTKLKIVDIPESMISGASGDILVVTVSDDGLRKSLERTLLSPVFVSRKDASPKSRTPFMEKDVSCISGEDLSTNRWGRGSKDTIKWTVEEILDPSNEFVIGNKKVDEHHSYLRYGPRVLLVAPTIFAKLIGLGATVVSDEIPFIKELRQQQVDIAAISEYVRNYEEAKAKMDALYPNGWRYVRTRGYGNANIVEYNRLGYKPSAGVEAIIEPYVNHKNRYPLDRAYSGAENRRYRALEDYYRSMNGGQTMPNPA